MPSKGGLVSHLTCLL